MQHFFGEVWKTICSRMRYYKKINFIPIIKNQVLFVVKHKTILVVV